MCPLRMRRLRTRAYEKTYRQNSQSSRRQQMVAAAAVSVSSDGWLLLRLTCPRARVLFRQPAHNRLTAHAAAAVTKVARLPPPPPPLFERDYNRRTTERRYRNPHGAAVCTIVVDQTGSNGISTTNLAHAHRGLSAPPVPLGRPHAHERADTSHVR